MRGLTLDCWEPEILKVMAELGNNIVNRILEVETGGRDRPRHDTQREVRSLWITAKYKEKAFVKREVLQVEGEESWTVKRLRRRARKGHRGKEALDKEDKDVDTTEEHESSLLESVLRASTLGPGPRVLNAEVGERRQKFI